MNFKSIIRSDAQREITEAFQWYENESKGLGAEFLRAVDVAVSSLERFPTAYPKAEGETRKILLRKFPYALFYIFHNDTIIVTGCFHQKRNPEIWQNATDN